MTNPDFRMKFILGYVFSCACTGSAFTLNCGSLKITMKESGLALKVDVFTNQIAQDFLVSKATLNYLGEVPTRQVREIQWQNQIGGELLTFHFLQTVPLEYSPDTHLWSGQLTVSTFLIGNQNLLCTIADADTEHSLIGHFLNRGLQCPEALYPAEVKTLLQIPGCPELK